MILLREAKPWSHIRLSSHDDICSFIHPLYSGDVVDAFDHQHQSNLLLVDGHKFNRIINMWR